jgi:flagellar M-ring protein FliF
MNQSALRIKAILAGFTPGQRAIVLVAVAGLALGAFGLARWVAQPTWTPLYGSLSGSDANAIVEQLRTDNVPYQLADGGATILVPQSQVYALRVSLSGKNLPTGDSQGYSLLDSQGLTATDFQQNVAYRRALEGELSKTLQAMTGVRTAIVHLAMPKRDVFASEQDKPTGSVLLALQPGTTLDSSQVRAITHLVAGSVEGLDAADVTVSDANGRMLSSPDTGAAGAAAAASEADAQTAKFEDRMSQNVQQMLDRVLGPGNSVVRVNAQLDYATRDSTSERFVSETGVAPLSQATVSETWAGGSSGAGGALGQTLPTLTPAAQGAGGGAYVKEQNTVNNAVGKVVDRSQAAPGAVQRLTVAVVLDAANAGTADPNQVQQLVANAVGLNPTRGDSVQVDKIPFDTKAADAAAKELAAADAAAKTTGYLDLAKKAGLGLLIVVALFLLTRRGKKDRTAIDALARDLPESAGMVLPPRVTAAIGPGSSGEAGSAATARPAVEPVIDRERMRDEVAQLVDAQPEEVAQVLQGWLSERDA